MSGGGDAREDFFLHGGEYADHVDRPRPKRCSTCAFRSQAPTVRPGDTSLRDLVLMTADYDSFVCHQPHEGETLTCRGWLAHHRPEELKARAARRPTPGAAPDAPTAGTGVEG